MMEDLMTILKAFRAGTGSAARLPVIDAVTRRAPILECVPA
jgi:hypothetical protein